MPKLIIEFPSTTVFQGAVEHNSNKEELEECLAVIVSDETAHTKDGEKVRFDPDWQVDIVLIVAAETDPMLTEYLPKQYIRSASQALCTLESYDFGDMLARKSRIARRVKELLGITPSENIQMTLNLLPEGHWERV